MNRVQRRRAQRLAGADAETGVMQGTPQRLIGGEAVHEGTVIVGAVGAAGEYRITAPEHDDLIFTDRSQNPAAIGQSRGTRYRE